MALNIESIVFVAGCCKGWVFCGNTTQSTKVNNNCFNLSTEPSSGVVDFASTKRKTVFNLENEAVLRFLVALSGTVSDDSTEILGHQKDLWSNAPRQVNMFSPPLIPSYPLPLIWRNIKSS